MNYVGERENGVSQHILTDETGSRQGHFFGFAFPDRGLPGALLCAALGKPGRLFRKPLREFTI
jgi:hypothetical protein